VTIGGRLRADCVVLLAALILLACGSAHEADDPEQGPKPDQASESTAATAGTTVAGTSSAGDPASGGAGLEMMGGSESGSDDASAPTEQCFYPARDVRYTCDSLSLSNPPELDPPVVQPVAKPFVLASAVGENARFTKLGGYAALATVGEGTSQEQVVAVYHRSFSSQSTLRVLKLARDAPTEDFEAIDVASGNDRAVYVLLCKDERCAVFTASDDTATELAPLPSAIPDGIRARGFAEVSGLRMCVYGDGGFACYEDGSWGTRQLEDENLRMLRAYGSIVATGEQGAFFTAADYDGPLTRVDTGTTETLVWGNVSPECWTARTESGETLSDCPDQGLTLCDPSSAQWLFEYAAPQGGRAIELIDQDGGVYRRLTYRLSQGPLWCAYRPLPDSKVVGVSRARCGDSDNWLLLTESAIYVAGFDEIFCAIE